MSQSDLIWIDVISDVVCPWCFIGARRLQEALTLCADIKTSVRWRPFQLDPTIPPEGMDRASYIASKFPPERIAEIHHHLEKLGAELGIDFAFDKITRSPNTMNAHRLICWSYAQGTQSALVAALFQAYFVQGRDIGDADVLCEIAAQHGLDAENVRIWLADDLDRNSIAHEIQSAQNMGIQGVPFFIIDGKFGLSGAQPSEQIVLAIKKALEAQNAG
jgi:predicted DsbA family dithiol-disulfide isomerase